MKNGLTLRSPERLPRIKPSFTVVRVSRQTRGRPFASLIPQVAASMSCACDRDIDPLNARELTWSKLIMARVAKKVVKIAKTSKPVKSAKRRIIKPWTKEDVRMLKAHSKARTPVTKVSKVMKRTVGALRRRAGILGVGLGHKR
jgi:hypothetical protein